MLSNILYIEDAKRKSEITTHERNLYADTEHQLSSFFSTSCGAVNLNQTTDMPYKSFPVPVYSPKPIKRFVSSFEFNMSSNVISISAKQDMNHNGEVDIKYTIYVKAIKSSVKKSAVVSSYNECNTKSSNGEWVKLRKNPHHARNGPFQQQPATVEDKKDSGGSKCILLIKSAMKGEHSTWFHARKRCFDLGGSLVKIESEWEEAALYDLVVNRYKIYV